MSHRGEKEAEKRSSGDPGPAFSDLSLAEQSGWREWRKTMSHMKCEFDELKTKWNAELKEVKDEVESLKCKLRKAEEEIEELRRHDGSRAEEAADDQFGAVSLQANLSGEWDYQAQMEMSEVNAADSTLVQPRQEEHDAPFDHDTVDDAHVQAVLSQIQEEPIECAGRRFEVPKTTKYTVWECQLCGRQCSGRYSWLYNPNLQSHMGVHDLIPLPCFIRGCTKVFRQMSALWSHLTNTHGKKAQHLSNTERQELDKLKEAYRCKTQTFLPVFFPETAFVGYAGRQRSAAAAKCKKCGEPVIAQNSVRIAHVLSHIKVRSECPIGGCNRVFAGLKELHRHLEKDHSTNLMRMAESEVQKFIEDQSMVNEAVKSVFHHYFELI